MRLLFVIDPLAGLRPDHDTSVSLMEAAQRHGAETWVTGAADLVIHDHGAAAWARPVSITPAQREDDGWVATADWWSAGQRERIDLSINETVLMRLDPPVNGAYLRATYVLDAAVRAGALVLNDPRGLREANEKLVPFLVPDLAPDTVVTADAHDIREALAQWGQAVSKPLDGAGGRGVILLRDGDPGLAALIDLVTDQGTRQVVVQEYLRAGVEEGDKRIFLLDGEPIGVINRRASGQDFRCNLALGAVAEETSLDAADLRICRRLRPELRRLGLTLVGIDVIGGRLTEVNVTSPTGIREMELFGDARPSDRILEWIAQEHRKGGRSRYHMPERSVE